jgi:hypothetical protein
MMGSYLAVEGMDLIMISLQVLLLIPVILKLLMAAFHVWRILTCSCRLYVCALSEYCLVESFLGM